MDIDKIIAKCRCVFIGVRHAHGMRVTVKHYVSADGDIVMEDIVMESEK